jgi:hypothetical protein
MKSLLPIKIIILFVGIFNVDVNAQSASVYLGAGFHSVNSKSLNTFSSNYNQMYSAQLVEKIDPKMIGLNLAIGANYALENGWLIGGEYSTGFAEAEAVFSDSSKMNLNCRFDQGTLYAGYTPGPFDEILYLYPFAGFSAGRHQLTSTNTPNSIPGINDGVYSSFTFKFVTGLHVAFGKENIKTLVRVLYTFPMGSTQLQTDQNESAATDPFSYTQNPSAYKGGYLRSDWRGLTVGAGLVVNFGL